MSTDPSSVSSDSPAIHLGAFLRTLIAPLIMWGVAVFSITAAGQPGVVCAALGLGMGIIFILVSTRAMPVDPDEVSKTQILTVIITVGGIVICAVLSLFTAKLTLRRYAHDP